MLSWPFRPRIAIHKDMAIEEICYLPGSIHGGRRNPNPTFLLSESETLSSLCLCGATAPLCPPPPLRPPSKKPLRSSASSPEINHRFDHRFLRKESQSREREAKNISSNNCLRVGGLSVPISRVSMPKKGDTFTLKSRRDVTGGSIRRQNRL